MLSTYAEEIIVSIPAGGKHAHDLQATYRYLRLAIILLTLLLGLSVTLQIISDGGVLPSVSAYYYTPARDVFVASLCGLGTCLIIHRGRSDLEDVLLNASGYLAFFVTFVPTAPISEESQSNVGVEVILAPDFSDAIVQNTWAVLIVGLIGIVLEVAIVPQRERHLGSRGAKIALAVSALLYLAVVVFFLAWREAFFAYAHGLAAIVLFVGIGGVVGINAVGLGRAKAAQGKQRRSQFLNIYTVGFGIMIVTLAIVLGPVRTGLEQWLFVLEALLILQFLAYWVVQTVERWHAPEVPADALVPG